MNIFLKKVIDTRDIKFYRYFASLIWMLEKAEQVQIAYLTSLTCSGHRHVVMLSVSNCLFIRIIMYIAFHLYKMVMI